MYTSISSSPAQDYSQWKTVVQPYVASTHLPTYKIIGAAPRPRCAEDDMPITPVLRRAKTFPASLSNSLSSSPNNSSLSLRKMAIGGAARRTTPVTRENLSKISMMCAREEDLDAPFSGPLPLTPLRKRTPSDLSMSSNTSNSDLPCITEEE